MWHGRRRGALGACPEGDLHQPEWRKKIRLADSGVLSKHMGLGRSRPRRMCHGDYTRRCLPASVRPDHNHRGINLIDMAHL